MVDTGLHALGWSRDRAIAYFAEHSVTPQRDIVVEVDRYLVLPGQALAYKVGEHRLAELRARASARLGDRFDVRAFHDELLRHGALPLDVLSTLMERWIESIESEEQLDVTCGNSLRNDASRSRRAASSKLMAWMSRGPSTYASNDVLESRSS